MQSSCIDVVIDPAYTHEHALSEEWPRKASVFVMIGYVIMKRLDTFYHHASSIPSLLTNLFWQSLVARNSLDYFLIPFHLSKRDTLSSVMSIISDELQPLLDHQPSFTSSAEPNRFTETPQDGHLSPTLNARSIELDTLPETAISGRNLTWTSAYMLTISRIVGSGIFATPGNIYKSVGSVGLALTVWVIGAAIAACGLAVSMELGCMLPRSGGLKVYLEFMYRRPRFLASTMVAIQAVVLGFTASNCIVFGQYVLVALDMEVTAFA